MFPTRLFRPRRSNGFFTVKINDKKGSFRPFLSSVISFPSLVPIFNPFHRYMANLPPLILPKWDRYDIRLPHIDSLIAIADKGRSPPRRTALRIEPVPSGLYKTAQDTINCDVPKLALPAPTYESFPLPTLGVSFFWGKLTHFFCQSSVHPPLPPCTQVLT